MALQAAIVLGALTWKSFFASGRISSPFSPTVWLTAHSRQKFSASVPDEPMLKKKNKPKPKTVPRCRLSEVTRQLPNCLLQHSSSAYASVRLQVLRKLVCFLLPQHLTWAKETWGYHSPYSLGHPTFGVRSGCPLAGLSALFSFHFSSLR